LEISMIMAATGRPIKTCHRAHRVRQKDYGLQPGIVCRKLSPGWLLIPRLKTLCLTSKWYETEKLPAPHAGKQSPFHYMSCLNIGGIFQGFPKGVGCGAVRSCRIPRDGCWSFGEEGPGFTTPGPFPHKELEASAIILSSEPLAKCSKCRAGTARQISGGRCPPYITAGC
jgi:hypothetical protein